MRGLARSYDCPRYLPVGTGVQGWNRCTSRLLHAVVSEDSRKAHRYVHHHKRVRCGWVTASLGGSVSSSSLKFVSHAWPLESVLLQIGKAGDSSTNVMGFLMKCGRPLKAGVQRWLPSRLVRGWQPRWRYGHGCQLNPNIPHHLEASHSRLRQVERYCISLRHSSHGRLTASSSRGKGVHTRYEQKDAVLDRERPLPILLLTLGGKHKNCQPLRRRLGPRGVQQSLVSRTFSVPPWHEMRFCSTLWQEQSVDGCLV
jgi:hypothetical protein